jgi:hypothetical protein
MIRHLAAVSAILFTFQATDVLARDLLSGGNPATLASKAAAVRMAATQPMRTYPEPFTTTPGRANFTCGISGLGRTTTCTMRNWAERRAMALRFASR